MSKTLSHSTIASSRLVCFDRDFSLFCGFGLCHLPIFHTTFYFPPLLGLGKSNLLRRSLTSAALGDHTKFYFPLSLIFITKEIYHAIQFSTIYVFSSFPTFSDVTFLFCWCRNLNCSKTCPQRRAAAVVAWLSTPPTHPTHPIPGWQFPTACPPLAHPPLRITAGCMEPVGVGVMGVVDRCSVWEVRLLPERGRRPQCPPRPRPRGNFTSIRTSKDLINTISPTWRRNTTPTCPVLSSTCDPRRPGVRTSGWKNQPTHPSPRPPHLPPTTVSSNYVSTRKVFLLHSKTSPPSCKIIGATTGDSYFHRFIPLYKFHAELNQHCETLL